MFIEVIQFSLVPDDSKPLIALMNDLQRIYKGRGVTRWQLFQDCRKSNGWMLIISYPSEAVWSSIQKQLESSPTHQQLQKDFTELTGGDPHTPYHQYFQQISE